MNNRPVLFSSACILSFLGGGLASLIFFAVSLFYNSFSGKITGITNELSMEGTSRFYFLLMAIAHGCSLAAVVGLWKFRANGFFLYVVAQMAIALLPVVFIGGNSFSSINVIFTLLFTGIYFFYYRWIKMNIPEGTVPEQK